MIDDHSSHHGHGHDHEDQDDHGHDHPHRSLTAVDETLDPANQALADALRSSFGLLKIIMVVLVIAYLASGFFIVDEKENAMVATLGKLRAEPVAGEDRPVILGPGFHWAWPSPISEVIRLSVTEKRTLVIDSQYFYIRPELANRPLDELPRDAPGLDPKLDGALLTGDKGLIHAKWTAAYQIRDLGLFVTSIRDPVDAIRTAVENAAIHAAGQMSAVDATRRREEEFLDQVKTGAQAHLDAMKIGVDIVTLNGQPIAPLQTRSQFEEVARQENEAQKRVREAQQRATKTLVGVAGQAHDELIAAIDAYDAAVREADEEAKDKWDVEIDRLLQDEISGEAAQTINEARSYLANMQQRVRADNEQFEAMLPEYQTNRELLFSRLWEQAKQHIFSMPDVRLIYVPLGGGEFRLRISPDPDQERQEEVEKLKRHDLHGGFKPGIAG